MAKAEKKVTFEYGDTKREFRVKSISIKDLKNFIPEFSESIEAFIDKGIKYDDITPFIVENIDLFIDKLAEYTDIPKNELEEDYTPAELTKVIKELLTFNLGGNLGELGKSLSDYFLKILKSDSIQKILSETLNQV